MVKFRELYELYLEHPQIQTDSRKIQTGDIFVALKGPHFDGNQYAEQSLKDGAAYALVDDWALSKKSNRLLYTDDALETLQQLARYHRLQFNIPVIAITGSNGKTTTKELMHAVLAKKYKTWATPGNLNNHIGIPLTLLKMPKDTEVAIIEMGANHQQEISFYCQIAVPNYGLITNIGKAHLEGFGGIEGVKKGKGELYDFIRKWEGSIFRNTDGQFLAEMAHDIPEQITYGTQKAQILGEILQETPFLKLALTISNKKAQLNTQLTGIYNLSNILAAAAVGDYFGVSLPEAKEAVEAYQPDNSRSQWLEKGSNKIILDAYNANPTSMKLAIDNIAKTSADNKWLLLGGMKELGKDETGEHQAIIRQLKALNLQNVLLCGPEFENCHDDFQWFPDASKLLDWLKGHPINKALVLIKGSRTTGMETVLPGFEG